MLPEYRHIFETTIYISTFLLFNVFILYPLILSLFSRIFRKPLKINKDYQPDITVVIAAYNEEKLIEDAVNSIYKSDYPAEKINVVVGSDGSTDRTNEILKQLSERYSSLRYFEYERSGKNLVLNKLIENVETEVIFYMDADIRLRIESIETLISKLSDENVGSCISSMKINYHQEKFQNTGNSGESSYQQYELSMRKNESSIHSTVNSLGAFYGIKMNYYNSIPNELVCDDLFPLYNVSLNKKRVIFTDECTVDEVREKSFSDEFGRRIRLAAGGLSTVAACKALLSPKYGWVSYFVWNHKLLRWFSPIYLLLILISTILLDHNSWLYLPMVISQAILYIGAFLGWILEKINSNILPFKIILFIVSMNIGFLLGIFRFLGKGQNAAWDRNISN